jgi:hypothetical protein
MNQRVVSLMDVLAPPGNDWLKEISRRRSDLPAGVHVVRFSDADDEPADGWRSRRLESPGNAERLPEFCGSRPPGQGSISACRRRREPCSSTVEVECLGLRGFERRIQQVPGSFGVSATVPRGTSGSDCRPRPSDSRHRGRTPSSRRGKGQKNDTLRRAFLLPSTTVAVPRPRRIRQRCDSGW